MASSSSSSTFLLSASLLLFLLFIFSASNNGCAAFEPRRLAAKSSHYNTFRVTSLLPSSECNTASSQAVDKTSSSLKVVHKHGPCSQLRQNSEDVPTHAELLLQDQARVDSIQSRLSSKFKTDDVKGSESTKIPAQDGSVVGTGNYVVTVGIGSPKKTQTLIFDTGSDLTWIQCQPCVGSCYSQKETIFNPSSSTSYSNISCSASLCNSLSSATGNSPGCSSSTCVYAIQYGDSSFSVGFFAKELLSLTSSDVFNDFYFGCGENNQGLFGGSAGLIGLGRDKLSLPSQTASKYGKVFSYCLPSSASSTGYLTFGSNGNTNSVQYTPIMTLSLGPSFYGIGITGLSVGGTKLSISSSLFSTGGTIIDSGTVITRLPPTAYSSLKSAFRKGMTKYPLTNSLSILDTCYDLSKFTSVSIPKIGISFTNGVEVDLDSTGIMYVNSVSQVCLAFAPNGDDSDVNIFGNVQQKTLQVVYDGAGGRVGFAPGGCS